MRSEGTSNHMNPPLPIPDLGGLHPCASITGNQRPGNPHCKIFSIPIGIRHDVSQMESWNHPENASFVLFHLRALPDCGLSLPKNYPPPIHCHKDCGTDGTESRSPKSFRVSDQKSSLQTHQTLTFRKPETLVNSHCCDTIRTSFVFWSMQEALA